MVGHGNVVYNCMNWRHPHFSNPRDIIRYAPSSRTGIMVKGNHPLLWPHGLNSGWWSRFGRYYLQTLIWIPIKHDHSHDSDQRPKFISYGTCPRNMNSYMYKIWIPNSQKHDRWWSHLRHIHWHHTSVRDPHPIAEVHDLPRSESGELMKRFLQDPKRGTTVDMGKKMV